MMATNLPLVTMTTLLLERRTDDAQWVHDVWICGLSYQGRSMPLEFKMGLGHNGEAPTLEDVLSCLISDAASVDSARSFEGWAEDLGYDPDSRSAERVYDKTVAQTAQLKALLGEHYEEVLYAERDS